jgi:hypothetical protein
MYILLCLVVPSLLTAVTVKGGKKLNPPSTFLSFTTRCERLKYPEKYDPSDHDDFLLDESVTRKISPIVFKSCKAYSWALAKPLKQEQKQNLCQHFHADDKGFGCGCTIPFKKRQAGAFLRRYQLNPCYQFYIVNGEAYYDLEIVKTLLAYGEMDPMLRICSLPEFGYAD